MMNGAATVYPISDTTRDLFTLHSLPRLALTLSMRGGGNIDFVITSYYEQEWGII